MFDDDEVMKPALRLEPVDLGRLGLDELQGYIDRLRAEIGRVEAEIGRKRSVRAAADGFFNLG